MHFCLIAPSTPTLFGVFAFHHRRSPFITDVCTPSIRCLYNNSSFHPCMHWKGLRLLSSSRAQETSCCTQLSHNLCSELHLGTLLLFAPIVSLQYLVGSRVLLHNLHVPSCNFYSLDSPYSLLMFDSSSSCHNTYPHQNRVPIFIPLLYFSSIIRVFINSTHREITVTESNFFQEITTPSDP